MRDKAANFLFSSNCFVSSNWYFLRLLDVNNSIGRRYRMNILYYEIFRHNFCHFENHKRLYTWLKNLYYYYVFNSSATK